MQKLFVLLTLLCASLSGSNAVAEFIEKRTDTLVNSLEGHSSGAPDTGTDTESLGTGSIGTESLGRSTYENDSQYTLSNRTLLNRTLPNRSVSNRSFANAILSELTLGIADTAKFGMEEGDNSDSFLVQAYSWTGYSRSSNVEALEVNLIATSNFSSYAIRAPPSTLS